MPHEVFISYASEDEAVASRIRLLLEANGITCWIDSRDIPGASVWGAAIVEAIQGSRVFVLILSTRSNDSRPVASEVQLADAAKLPLLPIYLEDIQPSRDIA